MSYNLQEAVASLIGVFHSYSGREGDKYKLSNLEVKTLFKEQLSDFLADSNDPTVVDNIMKQLDANQDGQVDFQEFVSLVSSLAIACNDFFIDYQRSNQGKQQQLPCSKRN